MKKTRLLNYMISILVLLAFSAVSLSAEEVIPAAYTGEELAKVRAWEKTWAGKTIDKTNIDQVAEFMLESYAGIYKEPEKWGAPPGEMITATIVPYKRIIQTKGFIEATKKYAPIVQTNPDGSIANYAEIAGMPYPNAKTGLEMAWNMDFNNHGDTEHFFRDGPNINPKTRTERKSTQEQWFALWVNRTEVDPKPAIENNKKGVRRGTFLHMWEPPEMANTRFYNLRYLDPKKEDVIYLWYANFRRIRRMSTAQRTDSIDGTDLIYDDEFFWDGHIQRNTYKYTGKKDLLCVRNQDMSKLTRPNGQGHGNGLMFERCNTMVVEAISKDPNYLYGKRVWYLDPETYIILWTEIYDQKGRFWKAFMQIMSNYKTLKGETTNNIAGSSFQDFQRTHSGYSTNDFKAVSLEVSTKMFTITNLQRTY